MPQTNFIAETKPEDNIPIDTYFEVKNMPLSRFSCVRLCATPQTAAHHAPLSLGFSRQEHWSGWPFPSSMHENEKWKWSRSVMSDTSRPHGLQPTRLLHSWDFPGKCTGVGCHCRLLIHHQLPEPTQTHVHWVSNAIQPSHPLSSPSPPALNLSQHQGPFQLVSSLHQVAKVLEFHLQYQSFQWTSRTDLL